MPDKAAFNKILRANITKASKLQWLQEQTGQPAQAIKYLLDNKGKKGLKILGKTIGSNIDSLAGYLHELSKEYSQKKPGRSKRKIRSVKDITPFKKNLKAHIHPNTIKILQRLASAHEIPYKVVDNAIKAGAPLKTLLKMLESETIPSERIQQHLEEKTKEKMDVKSAKNTKTPFRKGRITDLENKILQSELDLRRTGLQINKQKREDRKRFPKAQQKNRLNISPEHKKSPPTQRFTPDSEIAGSGKTRLGRTQFYARDLKQSPSDTLRITNADIKHTAERIERNVTELKRISRVVEGRQAQRNAVKSGIAQGLAGPLAIAASDKYLSPHAEALGRKIGEELLIPLGKQIDKALSINGNKKKKQEEPEVWRGLPASIND